jgi:hypothetical protein
MSTKDKELFILSAVSGFLGAVGFILGKSIDNAQKQQKRHMEDARTRFEYEQQNSDEGRDIQG